MAKNDNWLYGKTMVVSRTWLENVDILWQRKITGGGNNGYNKDVEMKMVNISMVRYEMWIDYSKERQLVGETMVIARTWK